MGTMPYWLMKTPEMVAMDHWFSLEQGEATLVTRYNQAITAMSANTFLSSSKSLGTPNADNPSYKHFRGFGGMLGDWLNIQNPTFGGKYWPHVPTVMILATFKRGITLAAQKGLGWSNLPASPGTSADDVFASELEYIPEVTPESPAWLDGVVPTTTVWTCAAPPGTGSVQVDAVRGPGSVQIVISTPWPNTMVARTYDQVSADMNEFWAGVHGGSDLLGDIAGD